MGSTSGRTFFDDVSDDTSDNTMTAFWRAAGLNYIQYSNVAAKVVRRCLKPDLKADSAKREVTSIKFAKWEEASKSARSSKTLRLRTMLGIFGGGKKKVSI